MTDLVKVALITSTFTSLPVLLGQVLNFIKLHEVAKSINGMKGEQIDSAMREGKLVGAQQEHDRSEKR